MLASADVSWLEEKFQRRFQEKWSSRNCYLLNLILFSVVGIEVIKVGDKGVDNDDDDNYQ